MSHNLDMNLANCKDAEKTKTSQSPSISPLLPTNSLGADSTIANCQCTEEHNNSRECGSGSRHGHMDWKDGVELHLHGSFRLLFLPQ